MFVNIKLLNLLKANLNEKVFGNDAKNAHLTSKRGNALEAVGWCELIKYNIYFACNSYHKV